MQESRDGSGWVACVSQPMPGAWAPAPWPYLLACQMCSFLRQAFSLLPCASTSWQCALGFSQSRDAVCLGRGLWVEWRARSGWHAAHSAYNSMSQGSVGVFCPHCPARLSCHVNSMWVVRTWKRWHVCVRMQMLSSLLIGWSSTKHYACTCLALATMHTRVWPLLLCALVYFCGRGDHGILLRINKHHSVFSWHQEITCVILCHLKYIIMSFKPFNNIIILSCNFPIELCRLRSYLT